MPNRLNFLILVSSASLLAGCGGGDTDNAVPPPPTQGDVTAATVDVGTAANTPAPAPGGNVAPPAATPGIDFGSAERPLDAQGNRLNDLDYLSHLVHEANEARLSKAGDVQTKSSFKTEAEQMAYEESQRKRFEPISDLNDLVKDGFLKSLPAAPAGQKYAIDQATKKVILTAQ
jgi:hypothetical protein